LDLAGVKQREAIGSPWAGRRDLALNPMASPQEQLSGVLLEGLMHPGDLGGWDPVQEAVAGPANQQDAMLKHRVPEQLPAQEAHLAQQPGFPDRTLRRQPDLALLSRDP
jgi:hypothetical protein